MKHTYEVIAGNVGCVYSGHSQATAQSHYQNYKRQSISQIGRVGGESVTLLKNGEPLREYLGTIDAEPVRLDD